MQSRTLLFSKHISPYMLNTFQQSSFRMALSLYTKYERTDLGPFLSSQTLSNHFSNNPTETNLTNYRGVNELCEEKKDFFGLDVF